MWLHVVWQKVGNLGAGGKFAEIKSFFNFHCAKLPNLVSIMQTPKRPHTRPAFMKWTHYKAEMSHQIDYTHSWGWFEHGWSSACPERIDEILLQRACLQIRLWRGLRGGSSVKQSLRQQQSEYKQDSWGASALSLFKLCFLFCVFFLLFSVNTFFFNTSFFLCFFLSTSLPPALLISQSLCVCCPAVLWCVV